MRVIDHDGRRLVLRREIQLVMEQDSLGWLCRMHGENLTFGGFGPSQAEAAKDFCKRFVHMYDWFRSDPPWLCARDQRLRKQMDDLVEREEKI